MCAKPQTIDPELAQVQLWSALRGAGLWPTVQAYEAGRSLVTEWGEEEVATLQPIIGRRVWNGVLRQTQVPNATAVRVLGFGRLISEYVIAPLGLSDPNRERVAHLGALANFIVSIYDHQMDTQPDAKSPILRRALPNSPRMWNSLLAWYRLAGTAGERFMARLVDLYYTWLAHLGDASVDGHIRKLIHRAILRMYDAEAMTCGPVGSRDAFVLRRKAVLPFVVMGLPAWLVRSPSTELFRWHLHWLYRLGSFFGDIDDVVDLGADRKSSHPNGIDERLNGASDAQTAWTRIAKGIVDHAIAIQSGWIAHLRRAAPNPSVVRAIEITTCSWFGGVGWRPPQRFEVTRSTGLQSADIGRS